MSNGQIVAALLVLAVVPFAVAFIALGWPFEGQR